MFFSNNEQTKKAKRQQRRILYYSISNFNVTAVTAHPHLSTAPGSNINKKQPLEVVHEQPPTNHRLYFSSLSDVRKKMFFNRLNSLEIGQRDHPNSNKELKSVEWEAFNDMFSREGNINLLEEQG